MKKLSFVFLCMVFSLSAMADVSKEKAVVRAVNRLKGLSKELIIPVGQSALFENISIVAKACYERPADVGIESTYWGFLQIKDLEKEASPEEALLFSGWMPSHSRDTSTLQHPIYDIWVEKCQ